MFKGNNGTVWFNGKILATLTKFEAKITMDYEEMNFCGEYNTHHEYTGWKGEGTMSIAKVDSDVLKLLKKAIKKGEMPEIPIISKVSDSDTGKTERISYSGVRITELMLAAFEAKKPVEEEIPFTFDNYKVLEAA